MKTTTLHMKRPRWSLKSSYYTALGILLLVTPVVLLTIKKSIWTELEILTGIISAMMFIYLAVIFYLGVHFDKPLNPLSAMPCGSMGYSRWLTTSNISG